MSVTSSVEMLDVLRQHYAAKTGFAVSVEDSPAGTALFRVSWIDAFMSMHGARTTRVVRWLAGTAEEISEDEYATREDALASARSGAPPQTYVPLLPPTRALPNTYQVGSFDSPVDVAASMTWRDVFFTAKAHARPLIEAGLSELDVDTLERARRAVLSTHPMSEAGLHALADVVQYGAHYLSANGFGSDQRFPDDALTARVLGEDGARQVYKVCRTLPSFVAVGSDHKHLSDLEAQRAAENSGVDEVIEVIAGRVTRRWSRVFVPDLNRRAWRPVS